MTASASIRLGPKVPIDTLTWLIYLFKVLCLHTQHVDCIICDVLLSLETTSLITNHTGTRAAHRI